MVKGNKKNGKTVLTEKKKVFLFCYYIFLPKLLESVMEIKSKFMDMTDDCFSNMGIDL